jgi:hypothetical protein
MVADDAWHVCSQLLTASVSTIRLVHAFSRHEPFAGIPVDCDSVPVFPVLLLSHASDSVRFMKSESPRLLPNWWRQSRLRGVDSLRRFMVRSSCKLSRCQKVRQTCAGSSPAKLGWGRPAHHSSASLGLSTSACLCSHRGRPVARRRSRAAVPHCSK